VIDPLDLQAARTALYVCSVRLETRVEAAHKAEAELNAAIEKAQAARQDVLDWCAMCESGQRRVAELQDGADVDAWANDHETQYIDPDEVFQ
jgi:hypothetical protein